MNRRISWINFDVFFTIPQQADSRFDIIRILNQNRNQLSLDILSITNIFSPFLWQYPALFLGEKKIADEKRNQVHDAFNFMENFLQGRKWFCGDNMTIADLSILASVSSIIVNLLADLLYFYCWSTYWRLSCHFIILFFVYSTSEHHWWTIRTWRDGMSSVHWMSRATKKTTKARKCLAKELRAC